jgi:hypothetical protein
VKSRGILAGSYPRSGLGNSAAIPELWGEILVKNITKIMFETLGMTDFSIFSKTNAFASYACMLHTSFV